MGINDAPARALGLPEFRQPTAAPLPRTDSNGSSPQPPATEPRTEERPLNLVRPHEPLSPRPAAPDGAATRTATSSAGEGLGRDPKQLGKVLAGLVALAFVIGDGLLRRYSRRGLRKPTNEQTRDFARPIAAIIARHTDGIDIVPDVGDLIEAGSAAGTYLLEGPLTVRAAVEALPDDYRADRDGQADAPRVAQPEPAPAGPPPMIPPPPAPTDHVTYL